MKVSKIKKSDVKRFYNKLADDRGLKASTIDSVHTVLHQVFEMAVDDDYIRSNPTNSLRSSKALRCFCRISAVIVCGIRLQPGWLRQA